MRKRLALLLAGALLGVSVFASCDNQKAEYVPSKTWNAVKVNNVSFSAIGGDEVMPIVGYIGPTRGVTASNGETVPSLITDEMFSAIEKSGVNIIAGQVDDIAAYPEEVTLAMDLAAEHNIGYFIKDKSLVDIDGGYVYGGDFSERMSAYIDHPAFCGLYFRDEPEIMMMRNMGIAMEEFYNVAGNKKIHPYFNLYPYLVWNSLSGYESYLNAFMETKPKYIAYDMYPFVGETAEMDDSYFTNLSIIRKYAKKYKIPFWAYLQSCGKNMDNGTMRTPTEQELMYELHTTLAYGAKGVKWFPLFHPHYWALTAEKGSAGLFYYDGSETPFYAIAQRAAKNITSVDHILMKAENEGIIFEGSSPVPTANFGGEKIQEKKYRELTKVEGSSVMVGCFDYFGKTVLYVVNNSITQTTDITLTFDNRYKYEIWQEGQKSERIGSQLEFTFGVGDAALVVLC